MEKFQDELSRVLHANVDVLCVKVAEASAGNPYIKGEQLDVQGFRQALEGVLTILDEALEGSSTELWDTYFETAIPGLIRRGRDAPSFAYICVAMGICMTHVLDQELPAPLRDEAVAWFTKFISRFSAETVVASLKAQGH